ncbi:GntR family transcriptional regulator [Devosia algicola]|uniref:GntR family transcriptional regulator n=1 Tax=Devosia algicola TaxID=3026418 RepID=A0ABY7YMZ5_9HYPH|nr:GntR family transcriptional regulator [Devosia algicola]WDR02658.1 GntR family transcriptional regulator [Devosia algicola]
MHDYMSTTSDSTGAVCAKIRNDILGGSLRAHDRLKVRDLAARYSVSTNPIREALHQLRGEGLVVITPNRGAQVRPLDESLLAQYQRNSGIAGTLHDPLVRGHCQ